MGIEQKSFGMLLDELFTTNTKCWFAQETIMTSKNDHDIAVAAKNAQALNKRRNELIKAIDTYMDDKNSPTAKTY